MMDDPASLQDAFLNCYTSEIEKCFLENNIYFKILLITENIPRRPPSLGDLHPNVNMVFSLQILPLLIQQMDQGVKASFKAQCLKRTFAKANHSNMNS